MSEQVEFIAERPKIFDNDLTMPWPDESVFLRLRDERLADVENTEEDWLYQNTLHNVKDEYFRMRYRGAHWPYETFTGEELPKNDQDKLNQFLARGYWAPAVDMALYLYEDTADDKYREAAIFAGGLHIHDAISQAWGFIDRRFANDSAVREKHILGFLERVAGVGRLPMSEAEAAYYKPLQLQYNLFFAEMAAQGPVSARQNLLRFDPQAREADEYLRPVETARASSINFSDADDDLKVRVVERFKYSGLRAAAGLDEYSSPIFPLECLHLFGLAYVPNFYTSGRYDDEAEPAWWYLSAQEIMAGDTSNLKIMKTGESVPDDDSFHQDSLF